MKQGLLIIDVQNDYFKNGKLELVSPEQALQQILLLEKFFKKNKLPVIYIQHINDQKEATFFKQETQGVRLHSDLAVTENDRIIEKHAPNSFYETDLESVIQSYGIEQLVITGMMTHMCIDSTTRASWELGYAPIVISDATATRNLTFQKNEVSANDVQNIFLAALTRFAQVLDLSEFLDQKTNAAGI